MAIKVTPACTVVTGGHVEVFRWLSIRGMLKLEARGMRTRGGPIRSRIAAELGLKPRASIDKYLEAIDARIEACRATANVQDSIKAGVLATAIHGGKLYELYNDSDEDGTSWTVQVDGVDEESFDTEAAARAYMEKGGY